MKYRWLNSWGSVCYVGKKWPSPYNAPFTRFVGKCLVFPRPGVIGNVLVELDGGYRIICPAGCLRMEAPE